jgi:hypothetical protein
MVPTGRKGNTVEWTSITTESSRNHYIALHYTILHYTAVPCTVPHNTAVLCRSNSRYLSDLQALLHLPQRYHSLVIPVHSLQWGGTQNQIPDTIGKRRRIGDEEKERRRYDRGSSRERGSKKREME